MKEKSSQMMKKKMQNIYGSWSNWFWKNNIFKCIN